MNVNSRLVKSIVLVIFLLTLALFCLFAAWSDSQDLLKGLDHAGDRIFVSRGPWYAVIAAFGMLLIAGSVIGCDIFKFASIDRVGRPVMIGLFVTVVALAIVPTLAGSIVDRRLAARGFIECSQGHGRFAKTRWASPGSSCPDEAATR